MSHLRDYPLMLYVEGAGDVVSAYLWLTSLEPRQKVLATVDWYGAAPKAFSIVTAQGGESHWEQLSMLISGAFGSPSACAVPALSSDSWEMAQLYLHLSTKKVLQMVRIRMFRKEWRAEVWFPGTRRNREEIEIPEDYRHLYVGDLFAHLMMNSTLFKIFL